MGVGLHPAVKHDGSVSLDGDLSRGQISRTLVVDIRAAVLAEDASLLLSTCHWILMLLLILRAKDVVSVRFMDLLAVAQQTARCLRSLSGKLLPDGIDYAVSWVA